jgi:hypothetical protein
VKLQLARHVDEPCKVRCPGNMNNRNSICSDSERGSTSDSWLPYLTWFYEFYPLSLNILILDLIRFCIFRPLGEWSTVLWGIRIGPSTAPSCPFSNKDPRIFLLIRYCGYLSHRVHHRSCKSGLRNIPNNEPTDKEWSKDKKWNRSTWVHTGLDNFQHLHLIRAETPPKPSDWRGYVL